MIMRLRLLFAGILISMIAVTVWAGVSCPLFAVPRAVATHPWFIATLCDAYFGFITFFVWVCWKETDLASRLLWLVAILLLGNLAMASYVLRELSAPATAAELLTRRHTGRLGLPVFLGFAAALVLSAGNWPAALTLPVQAVTALAGLCAAFALTYLVARRMDNYGIVDIAWAFAFTLLVGFWAFFAPGWIGHRILTAVLVTAWSLRLGEHLRRRVLSHHPVEDGRYVRLRVQWEGRFGPMMFGFFQLQAGSVVLLGLPFLLAVNNPTPEFSPWEIIAATLWLVALTGETLADRQLAAFKRTPGRRTLVCQDGLWRYSRHPNYFFDWLMWLAYALLALAAPWGALGILSPAIILSLLLWVTGIPLNEEQALRTKGEAYRRYQQTTSAFIPWFPRTPS